MKIDFLVGDNTYGSTVHFARSLGKALELLGCTVRLFWSNEEHFFHAFYAIMDEPPDFTCSFSDISQNGRPLGDLWEIPHLSILLDPAIYFLHQLRGEFSFVSCVDEGDCRFLNSSRAFFLPHGADARLLTPVEGDRRYDIVFFGSCIDYEHVEESWLKYPTSIRKMLHEAADHVLSPSGGSILHVLMELGAPLEKLAILHHEVDMYIRGKDRINSVKMFENVHVWGEGPWGKYIQNATIHPPITFEQTIEIMKESKVVLNSSPRFKEGFHERIFYALLCGCHVVTGETPFIKKHFASNELTMYRYGEWKAPFDLKNAPEMAFLGQKKVLAEHTWDARASVLFQNARKQLKTLPLSTSY